MPRTDTVIATEAAQPSGGGGQRRVVAPAIVGIVILLAALICSARLDSTAVGVLVILLMLTLMLAMVHIGIAMSIAGLLGIYAMGGTAAFETAAGTLPYSAVSSWDLSVIPLFIMMGMLVSESGLATRIYAASRAWLGWVPGSMAVTTNLAGGGLAATSGSTIGITYAVGRMGLPEMFRSGYHSNLALGSVMVSGTVGQLIPPSILLVVYAGLVETPIGQQLMAGLGPGLALIVLYTALIAGTAVLRPDTAPRTSTVPTWKQRGQSLASVWPLPLLVLAVLGSMLTGVATPTEAAALGVAVAVAVTFVVQGVVKGLRNIGRSLAGTVAATGSIFLLLVGTEILTRALALSRLPRQLAEHLISLELSQWGFLLLVAVFYLVLGMFLEPMAMLLLTIPMLLPALEAYDVSLLWFGAFAVLIGEIAVITPPVAVLAFVVHRIAAAPEVRALRETTLGQVYRAAFYFIPVPFLTAVLMVLFPDLVEWLPRVMGGD